MPRTFPYLEFQNISRLNPYWSSWTCFCETIEGRKNLSKKTIKKYFKRLVDDVDYTTEEQQELLKHLFYLKNGEGG